ncbi:MAG TPA: ribosome biogenesis GTPase YlqF [Clostridia bacterium]|nr:ribosome biogenesis GTPase YlqF [Clostridia bacterium]
MTELPSIQWFPGHMAKTRRLIKESLHLVDIVAELTDARVPESGRNPELDALCVSKPRILLLNKSDMADENITGEWLTYYRSKGYYALSVDCKNGRGLNRFMPLIREILQEKLEKLADKGMSGRTLRVMVAGIPNVGKSTFINTMSHSKRVKVEDRPGVTRGRQWISLGSGVEMMDTPGILWPKFEDPKVGEKLAFTGAVKDDVIDRELLCARLLEVLAQSYSDELRARYKLSGPLPEDGTDLLSMIGRKRGMLISGGEVDGERASAMVLDEFRSGKLGRITLEKPSDHTENAETGYEA